MSYTDLLVLILTLDCKEEKKTYKHVYPLLSKLLHVIRQRRRLDVQKASWEATNLIVTICSEQTDSRSQRVIGLFWQKLRKTEIMEDNLYSKQIITNSTGLIHMVQIS